MCPWCSWWWRTELAAEIDRRVRELEADGFRFLFSVLTLSHSAGETYGQVLQRLNTAWRRMTSGKNKREAEALGLSGRGLPTLRAPDPITGGPNGPHPHFNLIHPIMGDTTAAETRLHRVGLATVGHSGDAAAAMLDDLQARISALWRSCVLAAGGHASEATGTRHRTVSGDSAALGRYVAKAPGFEAVENRYRSGKDDRSGYSPNELLCLSLLGHEWAGDLWSEMGAALKGKRSFYASRSFKGSAWLVDESDDADGAAALEVDDEPAAWVHSGWIGRNRDAFGSLLDDLRGLGREAGLDLIGQRVPAEWWRRA